MTEDTLTVLGELKARHGASNGAWAAELEGDDLLRYTLAAVLRAFAEPRGADEVRQAMLLVIYPASMQFTGLAAAEFRRLVGHHDYTRSVPKVEPVGIGDWPRVLRLAHSHEILAFTCDGLWRAGLDVCDAPHAGLDARAVLAVMQMSRTSAPP